MKKKWLTKTAIMQQEFLAKAVKTGKIVIVDSQEGKEGSLRVQIAQHDSSKDSILTRVNEKIGTSMRVTYVTFTAMMLAVAGGADKFIPGAILDDVLGEGALEIIYKESTVRPKAYINSEGKSVFPEPIMRKGNPKEGREDMFYVDSKGLPVYRTVGFEKRALGGESVINGKVASLSLPDYYASLANDSAAQLEAPSEATGVPAEV